MLSVSENMLPPGQTLHFCSLHGSFFSVSFFLSVDLLNTSSILCHYKKLCGLCWKKSVIFLFVLLSNPEDFLWNHTSLVIWCTYVKMQYFTSINLETSTYIMFWYLQFSVLVNYFNPHRAQGHQRAVFLQSLDPITCRRQIWHMPRRLWSISQRSQSLG